MKSLEEIALELIRAEEDPLLLRGDPGPPGEDGARGPDGLPGMDGAQGDMGPQGPKGDPGRDGKDGKDGKTGPKGERGLRGAKGDRGERGPAGRDGMDGPPGPRGGRGGGGGGDALAPRLYDQTVSPAPNDVLTTFSTARPFASGSLEVKVDGIAQTISASTASTFTLAFPPRVDETPTASYNPR